MRNWIIFFLSIASWSCSTANEQLPDCSEPGIVCGRFDYTSRESFTETFRDYGNAFRWPPHLMEMEFIEREYNCRAANPLAAAKEALDSDSHLLWAIGKCLIENRRPRAEVFVIEQQFLRSQIPLTR